MMYSEKVLKSLCPPVFEFHFLKVSRLGVADQEFGNHEIFKNIDAGERLRLLKSRNSLAGAISMPAAPRRG